MSLEDTLAFVKALADDKVAIHGFRKLLSIAKQTCTSAKIAGCFFNFVQNSAAPVAHQASGYEPAHVVQQVAHTVKADSGKTSLPKKSPKEKASYLSKSSLPLSEKISSRSSLQEDDERPWTQVVHGRKPPRPQSKDKKAISSTSVPKSYVEVVSSPTPSSLNVAARFAGSNSAEITNMAAPQEVLPAALETCTTVHAPSVSASIPSSAITFLSDKERGQVLRGTAITRKLHLEFPVKIKEQLVQIRLSKLLGPDDDELHSLFAMSNSDAFKLKPSELGPALRVLWLDSHHTIMEKKAIISNFLFFSDIEMNE